MNEHLINAAQSPGRWQMLLAAAGAAALPAVTACSPTDAVQSVARALGRPGPRSPGPAPSALHELVHQAVLASSSHNTPCWRFQIAEKSITIAPDLARRCPAVDPDDHHLFVSLGCAVENMVHAALATGLHADPRFDARGAGLIAVSLHATRPRITPLYQAIPERQYSRGDYDGQPISPAELRLLAQAGTGDGVHVRLLTAQPAVERVLAYIVAGNTAPMKDAAFVEELKAWIRFAADEALRTGDGLFAGASGNPVLPRWLGSRAMTLFFTPWSENQRCVRQVRNSAGIAVFVSARNDQSPRVEAGRCYERFALQATALRIGNAFLNPPVEVDTLRPQFSSWLGLADGERPDLALRFGRGPGMPLSMRRPVQAGLV